MSLNPKGILYVCATPIGNLKDLSFRALDILKNADSVYCEDTRVSLKLCQAYAFEKVLKTLNKHNESAGAEQVLSELAKGKNIVLVSDAGTPNISDPGAHLIKEVVKAGYSVSPLPGACSIVTLLSVSGILANQFYFAGFFPKKQQELSRILKNKYGFPLVFFESPKRILKTLEFLRNQDTLEDCVVAKELTKVHEQIWYSIEPALEALKQDPSKYKGEWVLILVFQEPSMDHLLDLLKNKGFSFEQVMDLKHLGLVNLPRNKIYENFKK